ncbi:Predicted arabinose efflux permease, MFS family [Polaromonas sp. YR568]|uniref:MFS transporter n=1 Tax=Polaromonas sp. YR568 TaxID=1855301 RepID=UPI0008F38171|nr:MFS transporter [Polaromonas sp. YR568]SFU64952.1 Predicted arabinose efflux permease, MFS family [Polaromonas sp. YR568]
MAAGVVAALHVGKLPPALPVLGQVLGVTLLQAGFLLSLVQLAGMTLGLVTGLAVQRAGLRRSMVCGLLVMAVASALGGAAPGVEWLLASRVLEGLGFLWVVLPAPALVRQLVPPERLSRMMGVWGAYMPLGAALALLAGPQVIGWVAPDWGWRILWWLLAALAGVLAMLVVWQVPADERAPGLPPSSGAAVKPSSGELIAATLRSPAAWLMAVTFAMYSGQWLAVVGFLPSIYAQAGVGGHWVSVLTALAAAVNIVGNVTAGRLLGRGVAPLVLLGTGFMVMAGGTLLAFAAHVPPALQYAAVLAFSMVGGLIPATLFSLAIRLAPGSDTVSTTVGWIQQWSALGQFAGPPLVAWVAALAGGWQWTGWVTAVSSGLGLLLAVSLHRLSARRASGNST